MFFLEAYAEEQISLCQNVKLETELFFQCLRKKIKIVGIYDSVFYQSNSVSGLFSGKYNGSFFKLTFLNEKFEMSFLN